MIKQMYNKNYIKEIKYNCKIRFVFNNCNKS